MTKEAGTDVDTQASVPWAQRKKDHRNTVRSATVPLRGDLLDEVDRLEDELVRAEEADARLNRHPVAPSIADRILALEEEARQSEVRFSFEGVGRGRYARLASEHPATDEQKEELDGVELEWNPETFPPALLAESCVEPAELRGDVQEWTEIHENWSVGQVNRLWQACSIANAGVAESPNSQLASVALRRRNSATSSPTA